MIWQACIVGGSVFTAIALLAAVFDMGMGIGYPMVAATLLFLAGWIAAFFGK